MNPLPNIEKFIGDTLVNNGGVSALIGDRVYSGKPPEEKTDDNTVIYPCVVFSLHSGNGVSALNDTDTPIMELPVYTVKAITKGEEDLGTAHEITNAVHEALRNARGAVTYASRTVSVQGLRKQQWISYIEEDNEEGVRFNHVGATYRVFVSGLT